MNQYKVVGALTNHALQPQHTCQKHEHELDKIPVFLVWLQRTSEGGGGGGTKRQSFQCDSPLPSTTSTLCQALNLLSCLEKVELHPAPFLAVYLITRADKQIPIRDMTWGFFFPVGIRSVNPLFIPAFKHYGGGKGNDLKYLYRTTS